MKFEKGKLYTEKSETKTGKGSILRFSHYDDADEEKTPVFSIVKCAKCYFVGENGLIRFYNGSNGLVEWKNDVLPDNTEYDEWIEDDLFGRFSILGDNNDTIRGQHQNDTILFDGYSAVFSEKMSISGGDIDNYLKKDEVESLKRRLKAIDVALEMKGDVNDLLDKRIETANKLKSIS